MLMCQVFKLQKVHCIGFLMHCTWVSGKPCKVCQTRTATHLIGAMQCYNFYTPLRCFLPAQLLTRFVALVLFGGKGGREVALPEGFR